VRCVCANSRDVVVPLTTRLETICLRKVWSASSGEVVTYEQGFVPLSSSRVPILPYWVNAADRF
jgi:hypothetical protein